MKHFFLLLAFFFAIESFSQTDFKITTGPYLQNVTENEATIVWQTSGDAMSWVELAPDDSTHFFRVERPQYFQTHIGKKVVTRNHTIRLKNLQPGTAYRYRIYSHEVLGGTGSSTQYGKIAASKIFKSTPLTFRTLDTDKQAFSFLMVNDIHENNELLTNLLKNVKTEKVDFVVYNGDMVHDMRSPEKIPTGFLNKSVELFASEVPFYMVRGNHETRGLHAIDYMHYFPSSTGQPYYTIHHGNTFMIVLDSGEDKPDSNIEYGGLAAFDEFREEQLIWLKDVVKSDAFRTAKNRIVFVHMPPMPDHWHGPWMVNQLYVPVLNEAGVDLMLCGHQHRHYYHEMNYGGCRFPVLVNANKNKVRIDADGKGLKIKVLNEQDKPEFEVKLTK